MTEGFNKQSSFLFAERMTLLRVRVAEHAGGDVFISLSVNNLSLPGTLESSSKNTCWAAFCAVVVVVVSWQQQLQWLDFGITVWMKLLWGFVALDCVNRVLSGCLSLSHTHTHTHTQTGGHNLSPRWSINLIRVPSCQLAVTNAPADSWGSRVLPCMRGRESGRMTNHG